MPLPSCLKAVEAEIPLLPIALTSGKNGTGDASAIEAVVG